MSIEDLLERIKLNNVPSGVHILLDKNYMQLL